MNGPKLAKIDQIGLNWAKWIEMERSGPNRLKWSEIDWINQSGLIWTEIDQMDQNAMLMWFKKIIATTNAKVCMEIEGLLIKDPPFASP